MRWLLLLVGLTGCHKLFDLEVVLSDARGNGDSQEVDDDGSGLADAPGVGVDAAPCPASLMFDEDADTIDDSCDACPTIVSTTADADGDGLPNACDPDIAASGDRIVFARTFAQQSDMLGFDSIDANWLAASKGTVAILQSGRLRTIDQFLPTRIELRVVELTGTDLGSTAILATPSVGCHVSAQDCLKTVMTSTSVDVMPGLSSCGEVGAPGASLSHINFTDPASGSTTCQIREVGGATGSAQSNENFANGTIEIGMSSTAKIEIRSIVIYGAK